MLQLTHRVAQHAITICNKLSLSDDSEDRSARSCHVTSIDYSQVRTEDNKR